MLCERHDDDGGAVSGNTALPDALTAPAKRSKHATVDDTVAVAATVRLLDEKYETLLHWRADDGSGV